jgi:peptide/nickel transport system ATP-binding protein
MPDSNAILEVNDLERCFDVSPPAVERLLYRKGRVAVKALDGLSFTIRRGETFALVGESGCGKTTVARCIVGLYRPTAGTSCSMGSILSALKTARRWCRCGGVYR